MSRVSKVESDAKAIRTELLAWYRLNRRDLPWRRTNDPYAIWISEIMLQQTRVAAVVERYQAFMAKFPTVNDLATAPEQQVLVMWSGLGYYRRARMLQKAAQTVAEYHQGTLPSSAKELLKLPGIGSYTAAAIASIAYSEPVAVVDGNVERVLCRIAGWEADGSNSLRRKIEGLAGRLVDPEYPGDFNQAMMELGATVCLPRNPQCLVCPLSAQCETRGEHKTAPRVRMMTRAAAYALCVRPPHEGEAEHREVLLEQRLASQTVMPGLWEFPALRENAIPARQTRLEVRHAIMNVNYAVSIRDVREDDLERVCLPSGERRWVTLGEAGGMALTGLTRKVLTRLRLLPPTGVTASTGKGSTQEMRRSARVLN